MSRLPHLGAHDLPSRRMFASAVAPDPGWGSLSPGTLAAAHLFAVVLVIGMPVLGLHGYRRLRRPADPVLPDQRHRRIRRLVGGKCAVVSVLLLVWALDAPDTLPVLVADPLWWWVVLEALVLSAVGAVVMRRRFRSPTHRARAVGRFQRIAHLSPRTPDERRFFVVVAFTAGITEEVAYRAFLIPHLVVLLPGEDRTLAVVVAGAAFGLGHADQGWPGVVRNSVLGVAFGSLYLASGLLLPVLLHAVVDLALLVVPPDVLRAVGGATNDRAPHRSAMVAQRAEQRRTTNG